MTENCNKRSRKSKLVPRVCPDVDDNIPQVEYVPKKLPRLLPKLNCPTPSGNALKIISKPPISFNINIEVEEYDENAIVVDESNDDSDKNEDELLENELKLENEINETLTKTLKDNGSLEVLLDKSVHSILKKNCGNDTIPDYIDQHDSDTGMYKVFSLSTKDLERMSTKEHEQTSKDNVDENDATENIVITNTTANNDQALTSDSQKTDYLSSEPLSINHNELFRDAILIRNTAANPADRLLAVELLNSWGQRKNGVMEESNNEMILQAVLDKWRHWQSLSWCRETPMTYKCYLCKVGFWRLSLFRDHIATPGHENIKMALETVYHECHISAYVAEDNFGTNFTMLHFPIESNCLKCNKSFDSHPTVKEPYDDYKCRLCLIPYFTCRALRLHEGVCGFLTKKRCTKDSIPIDMHKCSICPMFFSNEKQVLEHLSIFHRVWSDIPNNSNFKSCKLCNQNYIIFLMHDCPNKHGSNVCTYCQTCFPSRLMVQLHLNMSKSNYKCRICNVRLDRQCMERLHLLAHSEQFMKVYRCNLCVNKIFYHFDTLKSHIGADHLRFFNKKGYYSIVLIMKKTMPESKKVMSASDEQRLAIDNLMKEMDESNDQNDKTPEKPAIRAADIITINFDMHMGNQGCKISSLNLPNSKKLQSHSKTATLNDDDGNSIRTNNDHSNDDNANDNNLIDNNSNPDNSNDANSYDNHPNNDNSSDANSNDSLPNNANSNDKQSNNDNSNDANSNNNQPINDNSNDNQPNNDNSNDNEPNNDNSNDNQPNDDNSNDNQPDNDKSNDNQPNNNIDDEEIHNQHIEMVKIKVEIKEEYDVEEPDYYLSNIFQVSRELRNKPEIKVEIKEEPEPEEYYQDDIIVLNSNDAEEENNASDNVQPETRLEVGEQETVKTIRRKIELDPDNQGYVKKNTPFDSLVCTKCFKSYMTLKGYVIHLSKDHNVREKECPLCGRVYSNMYAFISHIRTHIRRSFSIKASIDNPSTSKVVSQCKKCKEIVMVDEQFAHWESHFEIPDEWAASSTYEEPSSPTEDNGMEGLLEPEALKSLVNGLQKGMSSMSASKRVKACPHCNRLFNRYHECKRHIIEHLLMDAYAKIAPDKGLKCQICSELFQKRDSYKQHMRDHASLPVYLCELCNKAFSDSSNFTKHKKVHNLSIYQCHICDKKFQMKASLVKHIGMVHTNADPFICADCSQNFYTMSSLKKHIRQKHDKNSLKFKCMTCNKKFKSLKNKWDHMWDKHKQRSQAADCPICDAAFRKYSDVKRHITETHRHHPVYLKSLNTLTRNPVLSIEKIKYMKENKETLFPK
ncbi:uncharacterized protein LOC131845248 [Achroia grisella]|uniref:uncharacterized protein LOC131845248 n=1 Tax=Achroia grisella TaxID=688607 RepID=UPI0027D20F11|nr:uncharacterized protein LOC131845248 [Achroia grisella]